MPMTPLRASDARWLWSLCALCLVAASGCGGGTPGPSLTQTPTSDVRWPSGDAGGRAADMAPGGDSATGDVFEKDVLTPDTAGPDGHAGDAVPRDTASPDQPGDSLLPDVAPDGLGDSVAPDMPPSDVSLPEVAPDQSPDVPPLGCQSAADCDLAGPPPACNVWICIDRTCQPQPGEDGVTCDDGDPCTLDDRCVGGSCLGAPLACDDGNPCTADGCDETGVCLSQPLDGTPCDDGDGCTATDVCVAGLCTGTFVCPCQVAADCAPFEDGDWCNGSLVCLDERCVVDPTTLVECVDDTPADCTVPQCAPATGQCEAAAAPDGTSCTDDDPCTIDDRCIRGLCEPGQPPDCDDDNPCTDDLCSPSGACAHDPAAEPRGCEDGDPCTGPDVCADGACVPGPEVVCESALPCASGLCAPGVGCQLVPNDGAPCEDGDFCTAGDACSGGLCAPGAPAFCDDGNPCTSETCEPATGCAVQPLDGAPCDDGNPCTESDSCLDGQCRGSDVCECNSPADCAPYEDGNPCNGTLTCDVSALPYRCVVDPGSVVQCEPDGDTTCRQNVCDPASGTCDLAARNEGVACDDADPCTVDSRCAAGSCSGGAQLACDDGNPCTSEVCTPGVGCEYGAISGPCDDGDSCTLGDTCVAGRCEPSDIIDCDDGDACTSDSCTTSGECTYEIVRYGLPCDDGDPATVADHCGLEGECGGWRRVVGDTTGSSAALTDVTYVDQIWTGYGFQRVDTVFAIGSDRFNGQSRGWIVRLQPDRIEDIGVSSSPSVFQSISGAMASGSGGLVYRYRTSGWASDNELLSALGLGDALANVEFQAVSSFRSTERYPYVLRVLLGAGNVSSAADPSLFYCYRHLTWGTSWSCGRESEPAARAVDALAGFSVSSGGYTVAGPGWGLTHDDTGRYIAYRPANSGEPGAGWVNDAPLGCNPAATGAPCAGVGAWLDLGGYGSTVWALGSGGALAAYTSDAGWRAVSVPTGALFGGSQQSDYDFDGVYVTSQHVHLVGETAASPTTPEPGRRYRTLFYLHYDLVAGRFDPVRALLATSCSEAVSEADNCTAGNPLETYRLDAVTGTDAGSNELFAVGKRNRLASSPDEQNRQQALFFYLDMP